MNNGIDDANNESNRLIRLKFSWKGSLTVPWHTIDRCRWFHQVAVHYLQLNKTCLRPEHCSVRFSCICSLWRKRKGKDEPSGRSTSVSLMKYKTECKFICIEGYQMTHDQEWARHICRSQKIIIIMMVVDFSTYYNLHIIALCIQPKYLKFEGIQNVYNNGCALSVNVIRKNGEGEKKMPMQNGLIA